jgi:hypothetical protein
MQHSLRSIAKATVLGLALLFISIVIAFFTSTNGVAVNTNAWPAKAKAILNESPGTPITSNQWKRVNRELAADPNRSKFSHLFAAEVRSTWFVFLALSVVGLVLAHMLWRPLSVGTAAAVLAPTFVALLIAFQHVHPYYK